MKGQFSRERTARTLVAATMVLIVLAVAAPAGASHQNPLAGSSTRWTAHIREMDEALAEKKVGAAERAWQDAYHAALWARGWEGMIEVGDAARRIGALTGLLKASEAKARRLYLAALGRARQQGALDGMLRAAEALAALGEREGVKQFRVNAGGP